MLLLMIDESGRLPVRAEASEGADVEITVYTRQPDQVARRHVHQTTRGIGSMTGKVIVC
jgi:hypothetical protein